jgi:hypothetical protein
MITDGFEFVLMETKNERISHPTRSRRLFPESTPDLGQCFANVKKRFLKTEPVIFF